MVTKPRTPYIAPMLLRGTIGQVRFGMIYQKRLSGPLLDRIDTHKVPCDFQGIEVPRVDYEKVCSDRVGEPSSIIRARVEAAS